METPRTTPTVNERIAARGRPFSWGAFFAHKDRLARLAMAVALLALLITALALMLTMSQARRGVRFVVLDPAGNWVLAPGNTFAAAKELHVQQSLLAANALLLRNPDGYDQPEVLDAMFGRQAIAQALQLKNLEAAEFHDRHIQQKPQVHRINAIETRDDRVQIEVTGQLLRTGLYRNSPFTEVLPFRLRLTFRPNPDLLKSRRQPTIVTEFTLAYDNPSSPSTPAPVDTPAKR
ncbi:MAG: hypothetical protein H7A46_16975 [Verrucomicrobiales bacterium]|nr:hypothetical protein [Verrucomicrobiales bacterium]